LPKGTPPFESELVRAFQIEREAPAAGALLGDAVAPAITLVGSSYSAAWTQFADALGYTLQRDMLVVSVPATQGSWVGMESYLRDDAFQATPPKLIVWELPERDLRAPPSFRYREARYVFDNTEWLLRAAAWVSPKCDPARTTVKSVGGPLASASASREGDYLEVTFNRPLDKLEYLSARLTTHGSSRVKLEPSGPRAAAHPFEIPVAGDELAHAFRTPLYAAAKGYDKVRLYPGATHLFKAEEVQVCRQMEGLLR
jgi:alginate O-acetyltransferase complex protein AlgJ